MSSPMQINTTSDPSFRLSNNKIGSGQVRSHRPCLVSVYSQVAGSRQSWFVGDEDPRPVSEHAVFIVRLMILSPYHSSIVPKWGRAIYRPVGLDHDAGPSAIPYGSSQGWILNGNLRDFFFINLAISPIAVS